MSELQSGVEFLNVFLEDFHLLLYILWHLYFLIGGICRFSPGWIDLGSNLRYNWKEKCKHIFYSLRCPQYYKTSTIIVVILVQTLGGLRMRGTAN